MKIVTKVKQQLAHVRGRKARQRALLDFRRSLALIVDPDALEASVAMRLNELFDPALLVVLQLDPRGERYRPGFCSGVSAADFDDLAIRPQGRLARWFSVNETCLLVPREPGVFAFLDEPEQDLLRRLDVQLCAPLLARNRVAGMLLLGRIRREWPATRRDADLLMDLANQASLAFQNVALYREHQERLEDLYRADRLATIGQLTASIAHEVGNPLTAIRSTVQYLQGRIDDEDPNRELVHDVLSEVDRIRRTIDSMLGLTRQDTFEVAEIDLAEVLRQTVQLVEAKARKQSVSFEQRYHPSLRIEADPNLLRQVFLNLILNALQAMPEGGRIDLTTTTETAAAGSGSVGPAPGSAAWARVRVADDGAGIPEKDLERVFDRFFTTRPDGTGLGLAICREIIRRHRGDIDLQSVEGAGTTVSVRLPARQGLAAAGAERS